MARLRDDHIQWILSLDAKGVQSELRKLSSASDDLTKKNKDLEKEMKSAEKQVRDTEKEMRKLETAGQTSSRRYQELTATFQSASHDVANYREQIRRNSEQIRENNALTEEMVRTMSLQTMTMAQLKARARELERQLSTTSEAAEPDVYRELARQLGFVRNRIDELNNGAQQATTTFQGGLMVLAGNLMTKAIDKAMQYAMAIKDWIAGGLEAAGVIEGVARAFKRLDENGDLLSKLREQTRGLINDDDLMKAAVRADKYKINIQEVGNLLEFSARRANEMGKSVQDFQERIIDGIGKQSKIILDDLGLSSTEINAAIAETGSFAEGVIKIVNQELKEQGDLEFTAADLRQQSAVSWTNAQGAIGEKILWIEKIWNKFSIDFAGDVQEWATNTLPGLIQKIVDIYNWFVELYNESALFRAQIEGLAFVFNVAWTTIKRILSSMIDNIKLLGNIVKAVFTFDWDLFKQATTEYTNSMKNTWKGALNEMVSDFENTSDRIKNNKIDAITVPLAGETDVTKKTRKPKKPAGDGGDENKKLKSAQDLTLEQLETTHQERLKAIKEKYRDGEIKSEAEYSRLVFAEDQASLLMREELLNQFIAKTKNAELKSDLLKKLAEVQNKQLDQELKFRSNLEKIILDANPLAKEEKEYENRLTALNLFGVDKATLTKEQLDALELLEQQHQDNIAKIKEQAAALDKSKAEAAFNEQFGEEKQRREAELNEAQQLLQFNAGIGIMSSNAIFQAELALHNQRIQLLRDEIATREALGLETEKLNKRLTKEEQSLTNTYVQEYNRRIGEAQKYGQNIGNVIGNVMTGQADAMEAFGGMMIDMLFDMLSQIINAEILRLTAVASSTIAETTAKQIASKGIFGLGTAAMLTGVITAAMTVARTSLKGLLGKRKASDSSSSSSKSSSSGSIKVNSASFDEGGLNVDTTGGYTGDGGRYDVAGVFNNGAVFHKGEYIIATPELKHPAVLNMVRSIEGIRRQRTNANPMPGSFAEGGANDMPSNVLIGGNDKVASKLLDVLELIEKKDFTPAIGISELQAKLDNYQKEQKRFTQQ